MPKLIVITPESFLENEAEALNRLPQLVTRLPMSSSAGSCDFSVDDSCNSDNVELYIHIRKPNADVNSVRNLLENLTVETQQMVVLHDHFELKNDFPIAGIHQNTKNEKQFETYKADCNITSYASHSFKEIEERDGYSYYWLSPIFDSISKTGYSSNFSFDQLSSFLQANANKQVIALGGITQSNARQCIDAGFSGVAVLGTVWNSFSTGGIQAFEEEVLQIATELIV